VRELEFMLFCSAEFQNDEAEIIDEEEFQFIQQLRLAKQTYKEAFDQLKEVKGAIDYIQKSVDRNREKTIADFDAWYQDSFDHSAPATNAVSPNNGHTTNAVNGLNAGLSALLHEDSELNASDVCCTTSCPRFHLHP
jgi:hypothetical protein